MPTERGRFISFEGPEGAGKSTQMRVLRAWLEARGVRVVTSREPGGTPIGEGIREILLRPDAYAMLGTTEALLMSASRAQHAGELIRPALESGAWVLCDRYADSTLAYQGGGRGLDRAALRAIQAFATQGVWPELTLLLDLPVEIGLARRWGDAAGTNRLDAESVAFHEAVRAEYLVLASAEPERWALIDAKNTPDQVAADIATVVDTRFAGLFDPVAGKGRS
jgi:dTMP kinase